MRARIENSELILNNEGAVYHLNLKPEHLAPLVITVGDPDRVEMVSKYFDTITCKRRHREFVTHTGRIGGQSISVISSGIGPDNMDIVINELDALVNIDLQTREPKMQHNRLRIIRFGTSGSLQADIPVDSLVVSTHGIGLDNLMHYYEHNHTPEEAGLLQAFSKHTGLEQETITPYISTATPSLTALFQDGYHYGITVTCPGFYGPQGRILRAGLRFPNLISALNQFMYGTYRITNFEMETSALFGLCNILGHDCLAINTIVANRIQQTFSSDAPKAIDAMIQKNLELLCQHP